MAYLYGTTIELVYRKDILHMACSRFDLFERGWTEKLIKKYLGQPDYRVRRGRRTTGPVLYWKRARVRQIEASLDHDCIASMSAFRDEAKLYERDTANPMGYIKDGAAYRFPHEKTYLYGTTTELVCRKDIMHMACSRHDLLERFWTDDLIKKYLGQPDYRVRRGHRNTGPLLYWKTARVEAIEGVLESADIALLVTVNIDKYKSRDERENYRNFTTRHMDWPEGEEEIGAMSPLGGQSHSPSFEDWSAEEWSGDLRELDWRAIRHNRFLRSLLYR
jgi:hypothetical protein